MLRQQIAQMLLMGFDGGHIEPKNPLKKWLCEEGIGGVILFDYDLPQKRFGKNCFSQEQIKKLNQEILNAATIPPFIALDYEGGFVDRLKKIEGCPKTIDAQTLATLSVSEQNKKLESMSQTLKALGFNLNFAPVVDLNVNSDAGIIGSLGRSYSHCPEAITDYAKRFVKIFNQQGITCCYKHFPGHGSARGDTHLQFVDVTETSSPDELEPYKSLIQDKTLNAMIMTAHVINHNLDKNGLPATLSPSILTDLLRNQFQFEGIIISDDLQMHAITHHYTLEEALKRTINAGADMLIFGNQLGNISASTVIDIIERLVEEGAIETKRILKAYERILDCKQKWIINKQQ